MAQYAVLIYAADSAHGSNPSQEVLDAHQRHAEDGEQPAGNPLEHAPMVVREALLSTPWRAPSLAHGVHGSLRPQLAHRGSPVRARASLPTVRAGCYPPRGLAL